MQQARKKRTPRKITLSYLENAGLYYLQRYASSVENFKTVLRRKVKRSRLFHGDAPAEANQWIDEIAHRYEKSGLLNDRVYAESRIHSMQRKGYSANKIRMLLQQKGLDHQLLNSLLSTDSNENTEITAAHNYARRRRLGPYRTRQREDDPLKQQQKDMAALARQGFSYDIIRKVFDTDFSPDIDFHNEQA